MRTSRVGLCRPRGIERQRIFRRQQPRVGKERHQAERLPSRQLRDARHAVGEQRRIAAELVDDEAADQRRILGRDHRLGADEAGDDAAAIDIADQHHRHVGGARKAHIGDVVGAQIDLGGAAGAFDQHDVGLGLQAGEAVEHERQQLGLHFLIGRGLGAAVNAALHHDLRADLALRLQQHRIHVHARRRARRARLQRLSAADLAAVGRHRGIVRHVLRLERADLYPAQRQGARQPGDDQRFADVGAGALEHQRARRHRSELDARLRLHAGGEVMLHQRHLGDQIGGGDQLRLGIAPGDHDMQPGRRAASAATTALRSR